MIQVALLALLCAAGALLAEHLALRATQADARSAALRELGDVRSAIESRLSADVQLMRGLISYIRAIPDLDQREFASLAVDLMEGTASHIRNVALARDLVITHMYPLAGNEAALGLDYRSTPEQWPLVQKSVAENRIVVAGPLNLVQGGTGLVARFPVFLGRGSEERRLWGIVSTVIDLDALLDRAAVQAVARRYRLVLSGRDGSGGEGPSFWGDPAVLDDDPVRVDVVPVSGTWQLAGAPIGGWPRWSERWPLILSLAGAIFLLGTAVALLQLRRERERARTTRLLEQARNEAVTARRAAERASVAKSHFLANMSHDLRTPLNSIIGFSEMMRQKVLGPGWHPRYEEYLRHIHDCGGSLVSMIDDILDLSKIETEDYPLRPEPVEMAALLREVQERWRLRRGAAGRCDLELAPDAPARLLADRQALQRILDNLLSNAQRHAGEAANVRLSWQPAPGGGARLAVSDDGPGIPAAQLPHLVEPFYQGGGDHGRRADRTRRTAGHGLGLSIVKRLADLHDARLEIDSILAQGATFSLVFPAARILAAEAAPSPPPAPAPARG